MDKNTDFSTYFAELCEQTELTEQGQMLAADKNDKYLELGDTHIFTDGWERYRTMYDGVWDSDAERFINRDVKGACVLLENLYKRLQPLEADIIINYEKISWWPNDKIWMQDAYNICKEYHRQKAVMTMMEPQPEQQKYSNELLSLFKNDYDLLDRFVSECRDQCLSARQIGSKYKSLGSKVIQNRQQYRLIKTLYEELHKIGLITITYDTFKGYV